MTRTSSWFQLISIASFALSAGACGPESETLTPQSDPAPVIAPTAEHENSPWSIQYSRRCADSGPRESCRGGFGFNLHSDGSYRVGPGPGGESVTGALENSEQNSLTALAQMPTTPCPLTVDSTEADLVLVILNGVPTPTCNPALLAEIRQLLSKYHPETFPSPCISAAHELERAYAAIKRCERNSDCVYIDDSYLPLDPRKPYAVATDECSVIRPLVVANAFEAVSNQLKLLMKRELAKKVCGTDFARASCNRATTFNPSASPICLSGTCHLPL